MRQNREVNSVMVLAVGEVVAGVVAGVVEGVVEGMVVAVVVDVGVVVLVVLAEDAEHLISQTLLQLAQVFTITACFAYIKSFFVLRYIGINCYYNERNAYLQHTSVGDRLASSGGILIIVFVSQMQERRLLSMMRIDEVGGRLLLISPCPLLSSAYIYGC